MRRLFYVALLALVAAYTYYTVTAFAGLPPYVSDETWCAPAAYNFLKLVLHAAPPMPMPYPNASGIEGYLNLEHPPLVKYILALSILEAITRSRGACRAG
jgi:predicted membrane-bound dolichyl-phosphate-mannose-protein mannosyltransferase